MKQHIYKIAAVAALVGAALWLATGVLGAGDPRQDGTVVKTETYPDGRTDTYRQQADGEVVIEHQAPGAETWFESNEVLGPDGKPITCADGETLRASFDTSVKQPTPTEIVDAQRGLPDGKIAAFNDYTGQFQVLNAVYYEDKGAQVAAVEPLTYECGPDDQPRLVPLSEVDPAAAAAAREQFLKQASDSRDLTGLGSDPAQHTGNSPAP